jgi:predicted phosphatase
MKQQTQNKLKYWGISELAPPTDRLLHTKIEDDKGSRNESELIYSNGLWWVKDKSMYVYYTPTHWAFIQ